jgi:SGNH hydrolase-like domain, acetyltransferase AlgX
VGMTGTKGLRRPKLGRARSGSDGQSAGGARSSTEARPSADAKPSSPRYDGIVQGIGNGRILGWAADRADPHARVAVTLVVDGELVAEGIADLERADLAGMDLGDGAHGFLIALPEHLRVPARRSILALAGPERVPIPLAPSFWQKPAADGSWSDVVFEPGDALSTPVPAPPERPRGRAILEADGWLLSEDEVQDGEPPSGAELDAAVAVLVGNARRCAALGIAYIPALIPPKRAALADDRAGMRRRPAHELRTRLRDVDEVDLVDLLEVLHDASAAGHGALYHRTDADWNDRGAFFVARALLKEAHKHEPALCPPGLSDLHLRPLTAYRGALADGARLQRTDDGLIASELEIEAETGVAIDLGRLQALRIPVERHLAQAAATHLRVYSRAGRDEQARLAVIGDSAALPLLPWLAEHANRTSFFWSQELPAVQLELELPRVVLHLLREVSLRGGSGR